MRSFGSTELWARRQMNPGLDSLCRQIFANMKADTPEELNRALLYVCEKKIATKMRREGFTFRPVFKDTAHTVNVKKLDYKLLITVLQKQLKIEITL